jgi:molecular chaperone GrpE
MGNDDQRQGNTPENAGPGEAPPPKQQAGDGQEPAQPTLEQQIEQLEKLEQDKRELHDRLLRTAAEFENFKKRSKKEIDDAATRGREQLLKELLPALDNLERALKHAPAGDPLAVGIIQTEKQLLQALEKFGVVRFSSVGKPFDPSMHDAIQQMETAEHPPGSVAQEFASGYLIGQRLLRPAMVAVAKAPATGEPGQ